MFYRLEKDGYGPVNHPENIYGSVLHAIDERRIRRQHGQPKHASLDQMVDWPVRNWRSGCLSENAVRAFFAEDFTLLQGLGFTLRQYVLEEDDIISDELHAAAHTEALRAADFTVIN